MNHNVTPMFGDQADMLELLVWIALERGDLPVPSLSLSNHGEPDAHLTVRLADFEAWRAALGLSPSEVELKQTEDGSESYLSAGGMYERTLGVQLRAFRVNIAAWGLPPLDVRPAADMPRQVEDPHDSPLRHDYAIGHDLPPATTLPESLR